MASRCTTKKKLGKRQYADGRSTSAGSHGRMKPGGGLRRQRGAGERQVMVFNGSFQNMRLSSARLAKARVLGSWRASSFKLRTADTTY